MMATNTPLVRAVTAAWALPTVSTSSTPGSRRALACGCSPARCGLDVAAPPAPRRLQTVADARVAGAKSRLYVRRERPGGRG